MDCVVAPVVQRLPVVELDVSTKLLPWQMVSGPFADTVGTAGADNELTDTGEELIEQAPFVTVT